MHVISVIAWMAGLFYLPRLFVYHVEQVEAGSTTDAMFQVMERRLLRAIMNPAMVATWVFGLCLVFTPGLVDWGTLWPWSKAAAVLGMTWFHHWLGLRRKEFLAGTNTRTGRTYRMMNEVPTVLMVVIVVSVIVRF
ncbi:MAG: CopD family protein [Rhodobacteraceae bacterium]|nr:CopD family protein [Paracoccaceae bacterium]